MLSVDDTVACASCHHPDFGFTDGKPVSEGVNGQKGGRNAPTVFNVAYFATQFWDGRSPNLENQAEGPVQNPIEMAHTLEGVEQKLTADPTYQAEFEKAFGPGAITYEKVEKAIASFERTVISGNSPFDRYFYGGDETALSEAAKRGLEILRDPEKGNCTACHPIGLFTDNQFHNIGVGVDDRGELTDVGRYEVSKNEADRGAFKTPSLRNIALTAPYMHDGSLKTLKEVVDFYIGGGNSNPHLDPQLKVLTPTTETGQVNWSGADLEAFLEALTGEIPPNVGPLD
jgi:cytochrome c peroxidase